MACAKEKFFRALWAALELPADARFASFEDRLRNRQALTDLLSTRFRERPTSAWLMLLNGRVPIAPVRPLSRVLDRDAPFWGDLQPPGRLEVDIGRRLAARDLLR